MAIADESPLRDLPDRTIRQALQYPEHLRAFLEQVVPQFAPHLDCSRAKLVDRLFPLEDWRDREADLPFEMPFRLGNEEIWALVVVLIEHQSDTDRLMPLRLLLFAVLYWERQWAEWTKQKKPRPPLRLRPVLPIVLYTDSIPWGSTRRLVELLDEPKAWHAFAPTWEPLIWNLADQDPETLLASTSAWLKAMAVFRVEDADTEVFREVFTRAVADIAPLAAVDPVRWRDLMRMLLTWVFWRRPKGEQATLAADAEARQTDELPRQEIQTMNKKLGPTWIQESYAEGKKEGKEEGKKEGKEEGEKEGELRATRALLRGWLEQRFGTLPEALVQRIEATDDLDRLQAAALAVTHMQGPEDLPF